MVGAVVLVTVVHSFATAINFTRLGSDGDAPEGETEIGLGDLAGDIAAPAGEVAPPDDYHLPEGAALVEDTRIAALAPPVSDLLS